MTPWGPDHPLWSAVCGFLGSPGGASEDIRLEPLPSTRQVYRFTCREGGPGVVGKLFAAYPPQSSLDRGLVREYANYLWTAKLGLGHVAAALPRLLGRSPRIGLGLLVEDIPGPDLDHLIMRACGAGEMDRLHGALDNLAGLLAQWHSPPLTKHTKHTEPPENPGTPKSPAASAEALDYFDKVAGQLKALGFLAPEDEEFLTEERNTWEERLPKFPDRRVLVHGDATPTNFLFPNGRVVALDLERLRLADRLWDLSWVAGELKHAWGWRRGDWQGSEAPIRGFFRAYLSALPGNGALEERLHFLNPFYMALAELRIARNGYLAADYRRELIAEARRCLAGGSGS